MSAATPAGERHHLAMALLLWLVDRLRPQLGWLVFWGTVFLGLMPVVAVRAAGWVNIRQMGVVPEWVVLIGLATTWGLVSLQQRLAHLGRMRRYLIGVLFFIVWAVAGLLTLTQVIVHWLPSPLRLGQALLAQDWSPVAGEIMADLTSLWWRYGQWLEGVSSSGALQDDIVFLSFVLLFLWIMAGVTAWLALRTKSGLLLALPPLWALTLALYYGDEGRYLLVVALALAILLHLWLDQRTLEADWQRRAIDFSSALIIDRVFVVLGITFAILTLALFIPSPTVDVAVRWAYRQLSPIYEPLETTGERLFPDLDRRPRGRYGSIGSGLPNSFMLGAGPVLSEIPVMWVSTDRSGPVSFDGFYEEPPGRFYMRRATFADYNGAGWEATPGVTRQPYSARRPWLANDWTQRAPLRQWVRTAQPTALLYGAGEPVEPGLDYEAQARSSLDLVAIWAQGGPVSRYEVISSVPSADEAFLRALPEFDDTTALPADLEPHLRLPGTITERTRALAADLVAGTSGPYARAVAIETYLREYTYDLDVEAPPAGVDVADYFLFDLRRGYCDYYATAFVVLARLAGLPTRFATGFVPGGWNPEAQEWTITEAEAHSWPEVYFPELGWVPFEPTAGRAPLSRVSLDREASSLDLPVLPPVTMPTAPDEFGWNWQMLVWLLPLLGGAALLWAWLNRRQGRDPWLQLIHWGQRIGRPLGLAETELEYGRELSDHLVAGGGEPERVRRLRRSVLDLTEAVSEARYGPDELRPPANERARERWQTIRRYR